MRQSSLFGDLLIDVGSQDNLLLSKARDPLTPSVSTDVEEVYQKAAKTFELVAKLLPNITHELVTSKVRLEQYLDAIVKQGVVAIDTETDGLNPRLDKIAGISAMAPNNNPIYIPINHHFYEHNLDARWFVQALARLVASGQVKVLMHNAKFDSRVLHNYAQCWIFAFADTRIAAHTLNENEGMEKPPYDKTDFGLKTLWNKYCMQGKYSEDTYGELFGKRKFSTFDPERVYVYATLDVVMTLQLWAFQFQYLDPRQEPCRRQGLERVADEFFNLEMKVSVITTHMEERGIGYDMARNKELQVKYEKQIKDLEEPLQNALQHIVDTSGILQPKDKLKLDSPINVSSDAQLEIIFYEALGFQLDAKTEKKIVRKKIKASKGRNQNPSPRSVGKDAMKYFKTAYPEHVKLMKDLDEYKKLRKLYTTYIIGIRKEVDPYSHRVHGGWNSTGTKTGRMSSSRPNL